MTMNGDTGENNCFTTSVAKGLVYVILCQKQHKYNNHNTKWMQDIQKQKTENNCKKNHKVGNLENTFM